MSSLRDRVPKRMFEALDRKDVGVFLRFWAALPKAGRTSHPLSFFVWAAINELAEQRMSGAEHFATDQREARAVCKAEAEGYYDGLS